MNQSKTGSKRKTKISLYNSMNVSCYICFATSRYGDVSEAAKMAENTCVVIGGKSQPIENSIIRRAFVLHNFCMWDKL